MPNYKRYQNNSYPIDDTSFPSAICQTRRPEVEVTVGGQLEVMREGEGCSPQGRKHLTPKRNRNRKRSSSIRRETLVDRKRDARCDSDDSRDNNCADRRAKQHTHADCTTSTLNGD